MDYTLGVCGGQAQANLVHDVERLGSGKFAVLREQAAEITSIDELHGELDAAGFAHIEDTYYVLMRNLPSQKELLLEALEELGIRCQIGTNDFQGNLALDVAIVCFINSTHAAQPKHGDNFITSAEQSTGFKDGRGVDGSAGSRC